MQAGDGFAKPPSRLRLATTTNRGSAPLQALRAKQQAAASDAPADAAPWGLPAPGLENPLAESALGPSAPKSGSFSFYSCVPIVPVPVECPPATHC